ncbi:MAG: AmmeMemoRadiSam system protein A [Eubacteriales bacterium]|nr:AmmeMemoRadiSam system protein A [Eubacteriales bacterium]
MSILAAYAVPHPPIIIPEVGRGEEKKIVRTSEAYTEVMRLAAEHKPDVIVITSPHAAMYADYFHLSPGKEASGSLSQFRAPGAAYTAVYDEALVREIETEATAAGLPAGTAGEREKALDHGTLIPLLFLAQTGYRCPVVRVGLSGLSLLSHYQLGQCIARAVDALRLRTVFVASGDLSHKLKADGPYGFVPEGPVFDQMLTAAFSSGDFLQLLSLSPEMAEAAGECGWRSFAIMAGALDRRAVTPRLLSYEGPFGVGYAIASFEAAGEDASRNIGEQFALARRDQLKAVHAGEDAFVRLARLSLETRVRTGRRAAKSDGLPPALTGTRAGAFVSLKIDGQLRGCIGTISPAAASLADEIMQNAISAGLEDPRFDPVTENELEQLTYSVDVLGAPEAIASEADLDPAKYGVIVQSGARRGLLLPDLAGVDTVQEQIAIARQKAGIRPDEPIRLSRFEVVRHR